MRAGQKSNLFLHTRGYTSSGSEYSTASLLAEPLRDCTNVYLNYAISLRLTQRPSDQWRRMVTEVRNCGVRRSGTSQRHLQITVAVARPEDTFPGAGSHPIDFGGKIGTHRVAGESV
jgi:hypothetical protein